MVPAVGVTSGVCLHRPDRDRLHLRMAAARSTLPRSIPPARLARQAPCRAARWGADQAEAFTEVEQEFRAGDKLQFTSNNYCARRPNGQVATVMAVDPQDASLGLANEDGERQMLDLRYLADRHVRPGWVRTIHSAQGATAERVIAHLEAFRANIVDAGAAYVAISRARSHAAIYTDSRANLTEALGIRDGAQIGAIDGHDAGIALG